MTAENGDESWGKATFPGHDPGRGMGWVARSWGNILPPLHLPSGRWGDGLGFSANATRGASWSMSTVTRRSGNQQRNPEVSLGLGRWLRWCALAPGRGVAQLVSLGSVKLAARKRLARSSSFKKSKFGVIWAAPSFRRMGSGEWVLGTTSSAGESGTGHHGSPLDDDDGRSGGGEDVLVKPVDSVGVG